MAHSSKTIRRRKVKQTRPAKPYDEFPLFAHASGRWAKKVRGRTLFFGRWGHKRGNQIVPVEDVDVSAREALAKLNHDWPWVSKGLTPPPVDASDGCTIADACNIFLTSKRNRLDGGELSAHSFAKYFETCELLIGHFGKDRRVDDLRPDDFESFRKALAQGCGVVTLKSKINRCRVVLKYASDNELIDRLVRYGRAFDRPSAKMMRRARNEAGLRIFEAAELRTLIDEADPVLRAMILLGVNAGFGNTDVASLPQPAVDLDAGWVDFPRPKTEIRRRVPLWAETIKALREALTKRPEAKDDADADLCFLTVRGTRFVRVQPSKRTPGRYVTINALSRRFESLTRQLGINGRKGLGFYTLRHVFETIAGESRDQVAVNAIMGHVDNSMAAVYRERISDERLRSVTDCVHRWLFGASEKLDDTRSLGAASAT